MRRLRLLVVDDHEVVRQGLRTLLESHPGWEVCGEATSGDDAVEKARRLRPDVTILDVVLPPTDGIDVARRMRRINPENQILILTMHESDELISEVFGLGARGFVLKSDAGLDLVAAVEAVSQNKVYFSSRVAEAVLENCLRGAFPTGPAQGGRVPLSPREREVLRLLAGGRSNRQVATQFRISVKTVEAHRAHLMHKLGLLSISQLTRYAIRNGIIEA